MCTINHVRYHMVSCAVSHGVMCGITWCHTINGITCCHVYHQWCHRVSFVVSMVSHGIMCCINGVMRCHILHQKCHVLHWLCHIVSCVASWCHFLHRGVIDRDVGGHMRVRGGMR